MGKTLILKFSSVWFFLFLMVLKHVEFMLWIYLGLDERSLIFTTSFSIGSCFHFCQCAVFLSARMEAFLVASVCVSDTVSDRKKDLSKMKSLLDILTDPSKR